MISEIDIYRSARVLMDQYGGGALLEAICCKGMKKSGFTGRARSAIVVVPAHV